MTLITPISAEDFSNTSYNSEDEKLIVSFEMDTTIGDNSYIEYNVYDLNSTLLYSENNFTNYSVKNDGQSSLSNQISQIEINPEEDLSNIDFTQGSYNVLYNIFDKKVGSPNNLLYVSEISSDRTEVRLTSNENLDVYINEANNFITEREESRHFVDFYLNFGDNILSIANNIAIDEDTIIVKLYSPLDNSFNVKDELWVVTKVDESLAYRVEFEDEVIEFQDSTPIQGPNFNIELKDQINNSTPEVSYSDLINTPLTSSKNQLNSLLNSNEIKINVDYSDFSNFIHFSSAKTRLENFYYKMGLLEQYSASISTINTDITGSTSSSLSVNSSKTILQDKIDNIIQNFDDYEYYLYYESSSYSWPKSNSTLPYQNQPTGNAEVLSWYGSTNENSPLYGGRILSSSLYDESNKDNLLYTIPEYLREDPDNQPYELFVNMVAQHYDNIWIYVKDVTNKFSADNRLNFGVSKDLVADAIRDFGVKLYQNNFSTDDLFTAFLGLTPNGALFPFPNITGSLPTPTGYEYIDTLISASNDIIPLDDVNKSLYKRIYHNIPYLLKTKGTVTGLRALITTYGIPDTILRISQFGGKDKVNTNDWDYYYNNFNYKYISREEDFINTIWPLFSDWDNTITGSAPSTVQLRFQAETPVPTNYSQSLWSLNATSPNIALVLEYTGSALTSGSYNGSIIDPYHQYATLKFTADGFVNSSSVYLPFFDGGWWSVMVTNDNGNYTLHAGNKIYNGDDGTTIGFYQTSSHTATTTYWETNKSASYFGLYISSSTNYNGFSGSYQEIRYYTNVIDSDVFKDYIMNPLSIEGNTINDSPNTLAFRAALGSELDTSFTPSGFFNIYQQNSIHPKSAGSWPTTSSFISGVTGSNRIFLSSTIVSTPLFEPNVEYFLLDQPAVGIKNRITDKIRLESDVIPEGDTLSPFRRLAQTTEASASYTPNINYLEVAFSPQNEINDDIIGQLGYFNIGDYIGDPRFRTSSLTSYPDLDALRDDYFQKYLTNYNVYDFVRLIKYFDNSLFKMIKDFVPARTSLATGVVIKQHLLERNRYKQPTIVHENLEISGTLQPQWNGYDDGRVYNPNSGTGGSAEVFNGVTFSPYGENGTGPSNRFNITQSWQETYPTLSGSVSITHDSQREFYDGEFNGSKIVATNGVLNESYNPRPIALPYKTYTYVNTIFDITLGSGDLSQYRALESSFLELENKPNPGEILMFIGNLDDFFKGPWSPGYVKISKRDCNGNSNSAALGQITSFKIPFTGSYDYNITISSSIFNSQYDIESIADKGDYYLYRLKGSYPDQADWVRHFVGISSSLSEVDDYKIIANQTGTYNIPNGVSWLPILTSSYNPNNYYSDITGVYQTDKTPNTPLSYTMSFSSSAPTLDAEFLLLIKDSNTNSTWATVGGGVTPGGTTTTHIFTGSLNPDLTIFGGTDYYKYISPNTLLQPSFFNSNDYYTGDLTISDVNLEINQQEIPFTSSFCRGLIPSPYINFSNYNNSSVNPTINNATVLRQSETIQDIDYSTGLLKPTNFNLLINGLANKAAVQDSNYSSLKVTLPRYLGSKNQSTQINKWVESSLNIGNYGKTPPIESLKTYVAYCDFIGGWPPERMNSSGFHVRYLIDENGDTVEPNTSPNSLEIHRGTFESGERILISSPDPGGGEENPYRNIIRGGTRIEPILYNQIGHSPADWSSTIELNDQNQEGGVLGDYQFLLKVTSLQHLSIPYTWTEVNFDQIVFAGSSANLTSPPPQYKLVINSGMFTEGVSFILEGEIYVDNPNYFNSSAYARVLKNGSVNILGYDVPVNAAGANPGILPERSNDNLITFSIGIPNSTMAPGDTYSVEVLAAHDQVYIDSNLSSLRLTQNPTPNSSTNVSNLWISSSGTDTDLILASSPLSSRNIIYTTASALVEYFDTPTVYATDISGSGFNPISIPWSIKRGDEFRFEGREDRTYMVKDVAQISLYFGALSLLVVELDKKVSPTTDLDKFLIRRYVDDPEYGLIEGFRPTGTQGPYIVRPEFISKKLENNIDSYIKDLTSKGLL